MWNSFFKKIISERSEKVSPATETEENRLTKDDEIFAAVERLSGRNKLILLRQLAKELNFPLIEPDDALKAENVFTEKGVDQCDFPKRKVINKRTLFRHIEKEYEEAPAVEYETKELSVRVSKDAALTRKYVTEMYTNEEGHMICQMCQKESDQISATELANYGIEMPQLNLCLCRNCSGIYVKRRDTKKGLFKSHARAIIKRIDSSQEREKYEASIISDYPIYFTQMHIVELQKIFELMNKKKDCI